MAMFKKINRFLEALECIAGAVERIADAQEKIASKKRKLKPFKTVEGTLREAGLTNVVIPVRDQFGKFRSINQKLPPDKEAIFERLQALPRPMQVEMVKIALRKSPIRSANPDDEAVEEFDDARLAAAARPLILAGMINVPEPGKD